MVIVGERIKAKSETDKTTFFVTKKMLDVSNTGSDLIKLIPGIQVDLMAHSGGTFIGLQAAAKAPGLYHAYLAMSQITNHLESEKLAYNFMTEQFRRLGDRKMLRKFAKYSIAEINTPSYYIMRDAAMHQLGIGTTRVMESVITGVFLPVMRNKEYTLSEKLSIWCGKYFTTNTSGLWNKLVVTDLTKKVKKLDIHEPYSRLSGETKAINHKSLLVF